MSIHGLNYVNELPLKKTAKRVGLVQSTGARCVRKKKKKYYIILQGGELTCFHFFLSRRVKLIVTSERLNIFKKCFHQSKVK